MINILFQNNSSQDMKETDKQYKQKKKTKIEKYGDSLSVLFHEKKSDSYSAKQRFIAVLNNGTIVTVEPTQSSSQLRTLFLVCTL